jgi:hypothetical protein
MMVGGDACIIAMMANGGVATLALGSRPRLRGCKVASQEEGSPGVKAKALQELRQEEGSPGVTSHTPGSVRKCEGVWGSESSHSQGNSHLGRWSPGGLPKLHKAIAGYKTQWLVAFFISLESSWSLDIKMGLHCSFKHLKHKLWPKEGPGVELPVWLPTTKSRESTRFT